MSTTPITLVVACEDNTANFQLGETIAEAIYQTLPTLPMLEKEDGSKASLDDATISMLTNSSYVNGWFNKRPELATSRLVSDDDLVAAIADDAITIAILVPSINTLGINPGQGIAIVASDDHILNRIQEELLRSDDEGKRIHDESWIALILPPEYRMTPSATDPDTYVRAIANPNYVVAQHSTYANGDSSVSREA